MKIIPTALPQLCLIEAEPFVDERGSFRRLFCEREYAEVGLPATVVQSNLSLTGQRGTIRGMHFQRAPSAEAKTVRCVRGSLYDVVIDMRRSSPTYLKSFGIELDESAELSLFVPSGFAHGFQTLQDDTEVLYQMSDFYSPELSDGLRWNDPAFAIDWPLPVASISAKDAAYADFEAGADYGFSYP